MPNTLGTTFFNTLMATLKAHSNGPLDSNTVIAVNKWADTFGTARRG